MYLVEETNNRIIILDIFLFQQFHTLEYIEMQ